MGYSPQGCRDSDKTERVRTHTACARRWWGSRQLTRDGIMYSPYPNPPRPFPIFPSKVGQSQMGKWHPIF